MSRILLTQASRHVWSRLTFDVRQNRTNQMSDNRTHANPHIKKPFLLLLILICVGAVGAELLYFHLLDAAGILVMMLDLDKAPDSRIWTSERKLVWILGAGFGVFAASQFLLRRAVR